MELAAYLVNLVVSSDIEEMNLGFSALPGSNEFENDAEVVTCRTRPASLEISGKFVRPQLWMIGLVLQLLESRFH